MNAQQQKLNTSKIAIHLDLFTGSGKSYAEKTIKITRINHHDLSSYNLQA
mgnify:CR=1 FL=1